MTYKFTGDHTDRAFEFPSEAAYEAAHAWYYTSSKGDIVAFCKARGVNLLEPTDDPSYLAGTKLVDDWAGIAMELYAKENAN